METIILTTKGDLQTILRNVLIEHENIAKAKELPKLFTINKVAKKLGMAHATVKKLVIRGTIKSTKSGMISEDAINEYLNR